MALTLVECVMLSVCFLRASAFYPCAARRRTVTLAARSRHAEPLLERVKNTLRDEIQVQPASNLVVGVSGGCDSVALLHLLKALHRKNLHVIHFDHKQRGSESDGDREFVERLCRSLDVPFHCRFWSFGASFSQDAARMWRRSEMRALLEATSNQTGYLVTAHHKDDSEETLLLKFLRGAHITNLSGMSAFTTDEQGVCWIRPLIHVRKSELVRYLEENNHTWREDESNESKKYLRNRIRNELLPLLRDMVGDDSLNRRLENLEAESKELRRDLNQRANTFLNQNSYKGTFLLPQNRSEIDTAVRKAFHDFVVRESSGNLFSSFHTARVWHQLEQYPDRRVWRLNIGDRWDIECVGDRLRLVREDESQHRPTTPVKLEWQVVNDGAVVLVDNEKQLIVFLPLDGGDTQFYLTTAGSTKYAITPPWRAGRSAIRVSDFLRGQNVPLHLRSEAPIITMKSGDSPDELVAVYVWSSKSWVVDAQYSQLSKERPLRAAISI